MHEFIKLASLSLALAGAASTAGAAIVIQDPFTDGGFTNGADPHDANWVTSASGVTREVVNDPVFGSNALRLVSTSLNRGVIAAFPNAVTLAADGDYIDVTFGFRYASPNPTEVPFDESGNGARFGLYNDNGTPAAGDGNTNREDFGYYGSLSLGERVANGDPENRHNIFREDGSTESNNFILNGSDRVVLGPTNTATPVILTNDVYTGQLRITRVGDIANIQLSVDGNLLVNANDAAADSIFTFHQFAFSGSVRSTTLLDDVTVTTNVPEPGAAMGLMGLGGMLAARRVR